MCATCTTCAPVDAPAAYNLRIKHTNLEAAQAKIAQCLRWCLRNGIPAPVFQWGADECLRLEVHWYIGTEHKVATYEPGDRAAAMAKAAQAEGRMVERWVRHLLVDCAATLHIGNGAKLLGVLTHVDGHTLATVVKGCSLPQAVLARHGQCDHCDCKRRRRETFVVLLAGQHEPVVVGRACVRAYLGLEPSKLATMLEWAGEAFMRSLEDGEGDQFPARGQQTTQLHTLLTLSIAAMRRTGGYIKADSARMSTASMVWHALCAKPDANDHEGRELQRELLQAASTDEVQAEAVKVALWAQQLQGGDFELSMRSVATAGVSVQRTHGVAIYMPAAYAKAQGDEAFARPAFAMPQRTEALPQVGDKLAVTARITCVRACDGFYGVSWLVLGRTTDGWEFKAFTTSAAMRDLAVLAVDKAEGVAFKATVKGIEPSHSQPDRKQVVLTRMREV